MRAALQTECGQRLSTNDVVTAHVCSVVSARDPKRRDRHVSMSVNFRKRTGLPEHLLGNMVTTIETMLESGKPAARLAADLRGAVDTFAEKYLNHRANLRLVERHGGFAKIARFIPTGIDPFSGSLLLTSWSGYGLYDLDFGADRPAISSRWAADPSRGSASCTRASTIVAASWTSSYRRMSPRACWTRPGCARSTATAQQARKRSAAPPCPTCPPCPVGCPEGCEASYRSTTAAVLVS